MIAYHQKISKSPEYYKKRLEPLNYAGGSYAPENHKIRHTHVRGCFRVQDANNQYRRQKIKQRDNKHEFSHSPRRYIAVTLMGCAAFRDPAQKQRKSYKRP